MAIYKDLSGNCPFGGSFEDKREGGHEDLQAVGFRGTTHVVALSDTSAQSPVFSHRCRAVHISIDGSGSGHWALGSNPTALDTGDSQFFAGAVEIMKIRGGVDRIAWINDADETDNVYITEDLS